MLSNRDRRVLAEIERHLEDDPDLRRAFGCRRRRTSWCRRAWLAVLVLSLLLATGMAVLGLTVPAVECALSAVAVSLGLRCTSPAPDGCADPGRVQDRRR